jgi:Undecaprenyl-phosphate galactose phosphotransferase WbaP
MSILQPSSLSRIEISPERTLPVRAAVENIARPGLCVAILLFADIAALSLGAAVSVALWSHLGRPFEPGFYLRLWPVLLLFPIAYAASGLYPGFGRNPAEELRKLCTATSAVYPALAVTIFLLKDAATYSRGVFLMAWMLTLVVVPLFRALVRTVCARKSWWGHPVVMIGAGPVASRIASLLEGRPSLGLRPVAVVPDPELALPLSRELRVRHVILAMAETSRDVALDFFNRCSELFPNVVVIPDLAGFSSLWVEPRDFQGMLGLEVRQRLLLPSSRFLKRALEVGFIMAGSIVVLPVAAIMAVLIKLTSPGPVFYRQVRCGQGGQPFMAWKFRSMVPDANQVLEQYLRRNPELDEEWRRAQKLRHDPRVTRVGAFLRRTSLDELPQLWNVVRGQMSLVGPRPIVTQEIHRYGEGFALYMKVKPGLTGLWQVSGRNRLSYEERVTLDLYYVRNWSIWLDVYILARTVSAVILARGAY